MAGNTLNINSTLQCPHGGLVQIISANARVKAGGAFAALATDQYVIAGCPFVVGIVPMPCLTVQWILPDLRVKVNGTPTLSQSSVGLCLNGLQVPQGPVLITNAQVQAKTQ
jgi:hypothetical protein